MKKIVKKILIIVLLFLCLTMVVGKNFKSFAATSAPVNYTDISTDTKTNIISNMDNGFGVFRFRGSGFVKITLEANSISGEVSYPTGTIMVKNSNYQLIKKIDIVNYDAYAINNNANNLCVYLPNSDYYYIDISYDVSNLVSLNLTVRRIYRELDRIDMFDYDHVEQFSVNMISDGLKGDELKRFSLKQPGRFQINSIVEGTLDSNYVLVLLRPHTLDSEILIFKTANTSYTQTVELDTGVYYIGYFDLNSDKNININMNRKVTVSGSEYLMPDPRYDLCGSQIKINEQNLQTKSYGQSYITEGFTRLIYMGASAPSQSRLDYYWYSSDTNIATVTEYGTVLALPISVNSAVVKIVAVYKHDVSQTFSREFTVVNDTKSYYTDPIDVFVSMKAPANQYSYIDLSKANVPINILSNYYWSSSNPSYITITDWGYMKVEPSALGKTVPITGTYKYNSRVKIFVSVFVTLALSGYELDYNQSLWDGTVEHYNNCYAYALNNQVIPGTNDLWFKQQPGEFGNNWAYDFTNLEEMKASIQSDFDTYNQTFGTNLIFKSVGKYDKCPKGTYKVALVAYGGDYHWYRQDSDGYWSHKPGTTPLTRLDNSGNLIIDPETCDRGPYTEFLGFFAISGWNNMYKENKLLMMSPSSENSIHGISEIPTVSATLFDQVSVGMNIDNVVNILGTSGKLVGNGAIIHEYYTSTNETIRIYYRVENNTYRIHSIVKL